MTSSVSITGMNIAIHFHGKRKKSGKMQGKYKDYRETSQDFVDGLESPSPCVYGSLNNILSDPYRTK